MGYIGKLTRMDKKNKKLWIKGDGQPFSYHGVVSWAEKHPVGTELSYSHYNHNITWINKATPEYKRVARELKQKYGGKNKVKASRPRKKMVVKKKHGRK